MPPVSSCWTAICSPGPSTSQFYFIQHYRHDIPHSLHRRYLLSRRCDIARHVLLLPSPRLTPPTAPCYSSAILAFSYALPGPSSPPGPLRRLVCPLPPPTTVPTDDAMRYPCTLPTRSIPPWFRRRTTTVRRQHHPHPYHQYSPHPFCRSTSSRTPLLAGLRRPGTVPVPIPLTCTLAALLLYRKVLTRCISTTFAHCSLVRPPWTWVSHSSIHYYFLFYICLVLFYTVDTARFLYSTYLASLAFPSRISSSCRASAAFLAHVCRTACIALPPTYNLGRLLTATYL